MNEDTLTDEQVANALKVVDGRFHGFVAALSETGLQGPEELTLVMAWLLAAMCESWPELYQQFHQAVAAFGPHYAMLLARLAHNQPDIYQYVGKCSDLVFLAPTYGDNLPPVKAN